jgi:hypothetical protein
VNLAPRELPDDEYRWHIEVLMALDCLLNAVLRGWHHETLSSRAWRAWVNDKVFGRIFCPLIDVMFIWQTWRMDHCQRHHEDEVARADLIVKARTTQ